MSPYTLYNQIFGAIENGELEHLYFRHTLLLDKKTGDVVEDRWELDDMYGFCVLHTKVTDAFLYVVKVLNEGEDVKAIEHITNTLSQMISERWNSNLTEIERV